LIGITPRFEELRMIRQSSSARTSMSRAAAAEPLEARRSEAVLRGL
jgi:hypothetical protein